jgi:hypothetical protein
LSLESGVALHILDGHTRSAQLEDELDPADIFRGVVTARVLLALNGVDQPDALIITEREWGQPGGSGDFLNGEFFFLDIHVPSLHLRAHSKSRVFMIPD